MATIILQLTMPYEPEVSKNRRRIYHNVPTWSPAAKSWLDGLLLQLRSAYSGLGQPYLPLPHRLEITVLRPRQRGRKLDAQNLTDAVCDYVAGALFLDDHTFEVSTKAIDVASSQGGVSITFTAGE